MKKILIHVWEHSASLLKEKGGKDEHRAGSRYASIMSAETEVPSCVLGYHVYKDRWAAVVGELFTCSRKPTNASDRYAVAVMKDETTTGHLPRKIIMIDIRCRLELDFTPLTVHTTCSRSRSKYPNDKMFRWRNIS